MYAGCNLIVTCTIASDVSSIENSLVVDSVMLTNDDIMARISFKVIANDVIRINIIFLF